jgi:GT2 family glycosyltransferase
MKPIRFVCGTRRTPEQFSNESALGRSLKLYNEAIRYAEQHPAILVFIHDDVWLQDFFWTERIYEALERFDVVGLAGNTRRVPRQPSWAFVTPEGKWDEPQYLSGTVGHGKGFPCDIVSSFGPAGQPCKLLDGLMLFADSAKLIESGTRFDEQFMFHFYDLDFCRQAELNGLSMGTWPLAVVHESGGAFSSPSWREGYQRYLQKYGE